jgi:phosphohistidine swiveling domain-containing protein
MSDSAIVHDLTTLSDPLPDRIGGKGAGLLSLHRLGLPVPPAFVIPVEAFISHIASVNLQARLDALEAALGSEPPREELKAMRGAIQAAPLPEPLRAGVHRLLEQWAREFGGGMIVRSSATVEDSEHHSFAGIFESIPTYSGEETEAAILRVWASLFSSRAFAYYGIASLKRFPAMALILQPYVEADRSGVMFTRYAGPDQEPRILVEHVAGSGDKLVTGQVNPDRLWLPRWPIGEKSLGESLGSLTPRLALQLAEAAQKVELELARPQDVEWCVRDEQLYILQSRPITAGGEAPATAFTGDILLQGVGASPGRAAGAVHLVFNIEDADVLLAGQILTTTMTNPDMVPSMQRSAAVVTDVGGMICHAAIVSREVGIPCVVGTKYATQTLQAGSEVTVDGSTGLIFRGTDSRQGEAPLVRMLRWTDLWHDWTAAAPMDAIPLVSTYRALADRPHGISRCVLDPFSDLALDLSVEITPLSSPGNDALKELARSYVERLVVIMDQSELQALFLDLRRLGPEVQQQFMKLAGRDPRIHPLLQDATDGQWSIHYAQGNQPVAILEKLPYGAVQEEAQQALRAIPLGFGRLLGSGVPQMPEVPPQGPEGMFGMMPDMRMAPMPAPELRAAMHRLIPILSQAHGGLVPSSDQHFPWLDLRPEVLITPFLKAFVTPGVEAIPFVLGFDDPPLYIQFIRCRFHFRQDTLFGFFPKLMQVTWDEAFLSRMLQRCRDSYAQLELLSESLPADGAAVARARPEQLREQFVAWWNAFTEFFNLSFFIQAQGDDCVFPALDMMARANAALLANTPPDWQIPGIVSLSAPVKPVLTAEYIQDLLALKKALRAHGLDDEALALQALDSADHSEVNAAFERVSDRWHWMRERDPYYDPYDTPAAIIGKALAIGSAEPVDYGANHSQAELALALHFDLARQTGSPEQLVYAVKYGRALAIDRENHHIVWLRTSYRIRKLLLEWERQLSQGSDLRHRDIFFMQPWEILDAVAVQPQPISAELLGCIRNRRVAYEKEVQLKVGKQTGLEPQPEADYY